MRTLLDDTSAAALAGMGQSEVGLILDPDVTHMMIHGAYICIQQRIHIFPAHLMGMYWVTELDDNAQEALPVPMVLDDFGSLVALR